MLGSAETSIGSNVPKLPPGVDSFASRFLADVTRAQTLLETSWADPKIVRREIDFLFDYDNYPGGKEYLDAARQSCVQF